MKVLVSSCLLGEKCRYDGKILRVPAIVRVLSDFEVVSVCPEVMGGLPVPRPPSEISGGTGEDVWRFSASVFNANGEDVTYAYMFGSLCAFRLVMKENVSFAVLKSKSPACGIHQIYDGSFNGRLINGKGVLASLLFLNGVKIFSENNIIEIEKMKKWWILRDKPLLN